MENKIIELIELKIAEVTDEWVPDYYGGEEQEKWLAAHDAKLEVLRDLKYDLLELINK